MHDGVAEGKARLPDRLQSRQRILELPVGEHELVVPVVDDDARRQRFQHVGESPARLLGFGLATLHLGHVEDETGDVAFAAAEFDPVLAHDARPPDAGKIRILFRLVSFAGLQHLPFRQLEDLGCFGGNKIAARPTDHLLR